MRLVSCLARFTIIPSMPELILFSFKCNYDNERYCVCQSVWYFVSETSYELLEFCDDNIYL